MLDDLKISGNYVTSAKFAIKFPIDILVYLIFRPLYYYYYYYYYFSSIIIIIFNFLQCCLPLDLENGQEIPLSPNNG